jgi:serine/threonine-protein kinase
MGDRTRTGEDVGSDERRSDEPVTDPGVTRVTEAPPSPRAIPTPDRSGRYVELDELGVGGSGRVTSTWDRQLRRRVARKQLLSEHPALRPMLLQEARLLAWLDHPGAVSVYDIDDEDERPSYTMRLLDGETLRARLDTQGPLSIQEVIRILTRVSETMANAHAKGVLHLDLKPANLMLLPYGQVCVLDWGVAKFHDLEAYRTYLCASGEQEAPEAAGYRGVAGTPSYMPAEQVMGETLTPATDIYAVGTVLYEMLVGRLPLESGGASRSLVARLSAEVRPPRASRADVPERLESLCLRMLAAEPEGRPASFGEILSELEDLRYGHHGGDRRLQTGDTLFREGDEGDEGEEAFQILEGSVSVRIHGPEGMTEVARRGVGELIGEMAVVLSAPRSATVVALEPTRVAVVTGQVIEQAMESASPLLAQMLRSVCDRLREEAERVKRS